MSDTTTPSAAEVMGWRLSHSERDGLVYRRPDGLYADKWDCDDMLAFLARQGNDIEMWLDSQSEPDCRFIVTIAHDTWDAPTLHAALEQVVIAVGRAE